MLYLYCIWYRLSAFCYLSSGKWVIQIEPEVGLWFISFFFMFVCFVWCDWVHHAQPEQSILEKLLPVLGIILREGGNPALELEVFWTIAKRRYFYRFSISAVLFISLAQWWWRYLYRDCRNTMWNVWVRYCVVCSAHFYDPSSAFTFFLLTFCFPFHPSSSFRNLHPYVFVFSHTSFLLLLLSLPHCNTNLCTKCSSTLNKNISQSPLVAEQWKRREIKTPEVFK